MQFQFPLILIYWFLQLPNTRFNQFIKNNGQNTKNTIQFIMYN